MHRLRELRHKRALWLDIKLVYDVEIILRYIGVNASNYDVALCTFFRMAIIFTGWNDIFVFMPSIDIHDIQTNCFPFIFKHLDEELFQAFPYVYKTENPRCYLFIKFSCTQTTWFAKEQTDVETDTPADALFPRFTEAKYAWNYKVNVNMSIFFFCEILNEVWLNTFVQLSMGRQVCFRKSVYY